MQDSNLDCKAFAIKIDGIYLNNSYILGKRFVAFLQEQQIPAEEWKRLIYAATFIQYTGENIYPEFAPSDEVIEVVRQHILEQDDNTFMMAWLSNINHWWHNGNPLLQEPEYNAAIFRLLCRIEFFTEYGNGWEYLCKYLVGGLNPVFFKFLEVGFLVCDKLPTHEPPVAINSVYIINLDDNSLDIHNYWHEGLRFKLDKIPPNWFECLHIPFVWCKLAYAYTPAVKRLIKSRIQRLYSDELFSLVFEKIVLPYYDFDEWIDLLGVFQNFLFGLPLEQTDLSFFLEERIEPLLNKFGIHDDFYDDRSKLFNKHGTLERFMATLRDFGVGPLQLVLDIYSIPVPSPPFTPLHLEVTAGNEDEENGGLEDSKHTGKEFGKEPDELAHSSDRRQEGPASRICSLQEISASVKDSTQQPLKRQKVEQLE